MDFDRSVFAPAFADAGMWVPIRVTSTASPPVVTDTVAAHRQPTFTRGGASLSDEHEIEYQRHTLPDLAEGDVVDFLDDDGNPIAGQQFRVRQSPEVPNNQNQNTDQTGYFMCAYLTGPL